MAPRPLDLDVLARGIFNRAAIVAGGLGDEGEALQLCRDLSALETAYELRLKTERFGSSGPRPGATASGAAFYGTPIATKFDTACKVCRRSVPAGTEVLWQKGVGCACLTCGEVAT